MSWCSPTFPLKWKCFSNSCIWRIICTSINIFTFFKMSFLIAVDLLVMPTWKSSRILVSSKPSSVCIKRQSYLFVGCYPVLNPDFQPQMGLDLVLAGKCLTWIHQGRGCRAENQVFNEKPVWCLLSMHIRCHHFLMATEYFWMRTMRNLKSNL